MTASGKKLTRRHFMIASSAVVASPVLLNLPGKIPEAKAAIEGPIYFINRECIGCQVCRTFCPVKAIRFGDCRNEIVQEKCIHCGTCYEECPICAISETEV